MTRTLRLRRLLPVLLLLCLSPVPAWAQRAEALALHLGGAAQGWRPLVAIDGLLQDAALVDALGSGLPLRFRLRLELWERGFFDRLAGSEEVNLALAQDPLDRSYTLASEREETHLRTRADVQRAMTLAMRPALRPQGRGRYYYLATLEVETLSLSDLEELRRWLRGEAGPAVEGCAPPGRALERGLRRLFVRVIGLPTRRYEARTRTFSVR